MKITIIAASIATILLAAFVPTESGIVYMPLVIGDPPTPTQIAINTNTPSPIPTATHTSTPLPTITPTPTSTATSTNTPLPTATHTNTPIPSLPSGLNVLDNHSTFVNSIDYLHVAGEVENDTSNLVGTIRITVNLFDSQNQLTDTSYTYVDIDVLKPGDKTCFDVSFGDNPPWDYYTFEISSSSYLVDALPIAVFGDSGSSNSTYQNWYDIVGQVRNDNNINADFVKIVSTLYRNDGRVMGCDFTYANTRMLSPGQTSTWKITHLYAPQGTVSSYRLQAEGREE